MLEVIVRAMTPLAVLSTLALAGCNGTLGLEPALSAKTDTATAEPVGRTMIGKPYKVGGKWYHPKEDEDYDETGMASWYGADFHGARTANGETFDKNSLTAAHPTLPLPSFVRVTNIKNGKSAVVRVNDRGPFHRGRIVDVSRAAADKLGFRLAGSAKVRVEYLGPAPVDGGDKETLMAEAQYGSGSSSGGFSKYLPFSLGKKDDDEGDASKVKVRLASAEPRGPVKPLPGVNAPTLTESVADQQRAAAARNAAASGTATAATVESASAYQDEGGAIDALIAMNADDKEPAPTPKKVASAPAPAALPAQAVEQSEERVFGAFEMFAAIDDASGGSGELNGVRKPE